MDFQDIQAFQDSLTQFGIGGNDLALYIGYEPVYRYMTGFRNIEEKIPVDRDTMYQMFSMTKPVTCIAAMQLFEKGKFLLNDPLCEYLPAFSDMKVRVGKNPQGICRTDEETLYFREPSRPIEIQDLFRMQAGLGLRTLKSRAASGAAGPVGECGWNGAWGTYTIFDPENRFTLVFCEQASQTSNFVQRRLRNLSYAALEWAGILS